MSNPFIFRKSRRSHISQQKATVPQCHSCNRQACRMALALFRDGLSVHQERHCLSSLSAVSQPHNSISSISSISSLCVGGFGQFFLVCLPEQGWDFKMAVAVKVKYEIP